MFRSTLAALLVLLAAAGSVGAQQYVVVLLDNSGSMKEPMGDGSGRRKIDVAKEALLSVMRELPQDAQVGVRALNSRGGADAEWLIPLGPVDAEQLDRQIQLIRAEGGTPLGAELGVAADVLVEAYNQARYGTFRLLVVTDGEANDAQLVEYFLPQILARGISVNVIGVRMSADHSLATRVHAYRRADDAESLREALAESLAETVDAADDGAAESEFELLAGLPDELALAAIEALSRSTVPPIDEPPDSLPRAVSPSVTPTSGWTGNNQPPGGRAAEHRGVPVWLVILIALLVFSFISKLGRLARRH